MKKKKNILLTTVALLVLATAYFMFKDNSVEVSIMKGYKGSIIKTIEVSGIINSSDLEVIPLQQNIVVLKTYVKENDYVEKNQLLAELDAKELFISMEKAKLNLEELNDKLTDVVKDNSDLILTENSLIKSNEEYSKTQEDLTKAKEDLTKAEALYNENVISKTEYDKYVSSVNNLSSKLKTTELNLKDATISYNERKEQKSKEKLSLERQIKSLNLDIESLNNKIEDSKIYSSISGIITEFPIKELQRTLSGEIITIHGTSSYEITSLVSQQDAAMIEEGQKSIVTVDGLNTIYEGVVQFVSRVAIADNNGSMLPKTEVKITIINPDDNLTFGYEAEAKIIIDSQDDVLVVKNESIKKEDNMEFVYLIDNNFAKKTYVETGLTDGYLTKVISGINQNDVVIVNPPVDLIDGMQVKTVE